MYLLLLLIGAVRCTDADVDVLFDTLASLKPHHLSADGRHSFLDADFRDKETGDWFYVHANVSLHKNVVALHHEPVHRRFIRTCEIVSSSAAAAHHDQQHQQHQRIVVEFVRFDDAVTMISHTDTQEHLDKNLVGKDLLLDERLCGDLSTDATSIRPRQIVGVSRVDANTIALQTALQTQPLSIFRHCDVRVRTSRLPRRVALPLHESAPAMQFDLQHSGRKRFLGGVLSSIGEFFVSAAIRVAEVAKSVATAVIAVGQLLTEGEIAVDEQRLLLDERQDIAAQAMEPVMMNEGADDGENTGGCSVNAAVKLTAGQFELKAGFDIALRIEDFDIVAMHALIDGGLAYSTRGAIDPETGERGGVGADAWLEFECVTKWFNVLQNLQLTLPTAVPLSLTIDVDVRPGFQTIVKAAARVVDVDVTMSACLRAGIEYNVERRQLEPVYATDIDASTGAPPSDVTVSFEMTALVYVECKIVVAIGVFKLSIGGPSLLLRPQLRAVASPALSTQPGAADYMTVTLGANLGITLGGKIHIALGQVDIVEHELGSIELAKPEIMLGTRKFLLGRRRGVQQQQQQQQPSPAFFGPINTEPVPGAVWFGNQTNLVTGEVCTLNIERVAMGSCDAFAFHGQVLFLVETKCPSFVNPITGKPDRCTLSGLYRGRSEAGRVFRTDDPRYIMDILQSVTDPCVAGQGPNGELQSLDWVYFCASTQQIEVVASLPLTIDTPRLMSGLMSERVIGMTMARQYQWQAERYEGGVVAASSDAALSELRRTRKRSLDGNKCATDWSVYQSKPGDPGTIVGKNGASDERNNRSPPPTQQSPGECQPVQAKIYNTTALMYG